MVAARERDLARRWRQEKAQILPLVPGGGKARDARHRHPPLGGLQPHAHVITRNGRARAKRLLPPDAGATANAEEQRLRKDASAADQVRSAFPCAHRLAHLSVTLLDMRHFGRTAPDVATGARSIAYQWVGSRFLAIIAGAASRRAIRGHRVIRGTIAVSACGPSIVALPC